ncbi:MAG: hypothetical protein Kow0054_25440 [Deferrisoma sp.]
MGTPPAPRAAGRVGREIGPFPTDCVCHGLVSGNERPDTLTDPASTGNNCLPPVSPRNFLAP